MTLTEDIEAKVRRDFPPDERLVVIELLAEWQRDHQRDGGSDRILRCMLFLACGNFDALAAAAAEARRDYRDLIVAAEYDRVRGRVRDWNRPFGISALRDLNIHDYLIDQTGLDWTELLQEWRWLLPPEFTVWLLTRTGNVFIALPDASIHLLDVEAGKLWPIAKSRDEFQVRIDVEGVAERWLKIPLVDQLVASGMVLGPQQCYSFHQLPALGGSDGPENRRVLPIHEHFNVWGSIHRQHAQPGINTSMQC